MGRPRKLNFRERASCFRSCDRFSDLPDSIIHHIFSFVRPEDMVRIGILSRRFQQLFISSPYLYFRGNHDDRINACTKRCKQRSSYVTDAFRIRDGMKIYRFGLELNCINPDEALLNLWIQYALNCQVEEMDLVINLYFSDKNPYVLPRCIFKSSSLRDLRLKFNFRRYCCSLKLEPENFDFSSLQVLSLSNVKLTDDYFCEWISTYCKSLRELKLCSVDGLKKLSIKNSSLEDLSISSWFSKLESFTVSAKKLQTLSISTGKDQYDSENTISMRIKAPSLETLTWEGDIRVRFSGNFNAIKSATVVDNITDPTCDSIVEILRSVSQARVLNVHITAIEDLFVKNRLPILFDHVDHLVVKGNAIRDCRIPAIASFLRGLPNLRTLNVECISKIRVRRAHYRESLEDSMSHTEYEEPPSLLFSHLKEVEVEIVKNNADLRLVKYLLKFAKRLEKMTVFCSGAFLEELAMSGVGARSFETASSSVSLYFMHKKVDEDII